MPTTNLRRGREETRRFRTGEWDVAPSWIGVREASELSGYDLEYIRQWIRRRRIKAQKLRGGREWMVDNSTFQAYVNEMKQLGSDKYNPYRVKD